MKDKICFVVQRYGKEVNGGAELHCKQLAEHMTKYYDVEVITTKAIDYETWKNEYEADEEVLNGVLVHRFSVDYERNIDFFNKLSQTVLQCHASRDEEIFWMKKQGPYSSSLLSYIEKNRDRYSVFIFFTYLYCTTYFGLPLVNDKAILIPTAHDERPIYLGIFNELFLSPKGIFYNTKIEKEFVEKKFYNGFILNNNGMGGVGVDIPQNVSGERFTEKFDLGKFILYIGRIDEHKGCRELFQYFQEYKKRNENNIKLVLLGRQMIDIPVDDNIVNLGFVDDQEKFDALDACEFLVLPSQFESLSMVVLEAMAMKKAVLVHGNCEVVKEHCLKSNGGLYYYNYFEFEGACNYMLTHKEEIAKMGDNGRRYVDENYNWDVISTRLKNMIAQVVKDRGEPI